MSIAPFLLTFLYFLYVFFFIITFMLFIYKKSKNKNIFFKKTHTTYTHSFLNILKDVLLNIPRAHAYKSVYFLMKAFFDKKKSFLDLHYYILTRLMIFIIGVSKTNLIRSWEFVECLEKIVKMTKKH